MTEENESTLDLQVGDRVRLTVSLPYIKTADPMPMLRPPNVVAVGEEGTVMDYRPGGCWGVRFKKGIFLMASENLEKVEDSESAADESADEPEAVEDESADVAG